MEAEWPGSTSRIYHGGMGRCHSGFTQNETQCRPLSSTAHPAHVLAMDTSCVPNRTLSHSALLNAFLILVYYFFYTLFSLIVCGLGRSHLVQSVFICFLSSVCAFSCLLSFFSSSPPHSTVGSISICFH